MLENFDFSLNIPNENLSQLYIGLMITTIAQNDSILAANCEILSLLKNRPQDKTAILASYEKMAKKSAIERGVALAAKFGK